MRLACNDLFAADIEQPAPRTHRFPPGEVLPDKTITIFGAIVSDVESTPPEIRVGGRQLGEVFEDAIVLKSLTNTAFRVTKTEIIGNGLTIESIENGKSYRLRQHVCEIGTVETQAKISIEVAGKSTSIIVPVRYRGFAKE